MRFLATYDPETFLPNVADACENLAGILWEGEHPEEAEPLLREALECYRTLAASDPDEDGLPALIPEAGPPMGVLATILAEEGRAKEARSSFGRVSRCTPFSRRHIPSVRTSGSGRRPFAKASRSCQLGCRVAGR